MFSLRGPKLKIFAGVLALIAIAAGIYMMFFESRGFVSTTATITDIERSYGSGDNDDTFIPTIIRRNGQEIATAVSSSQNVHEEDEEEKSRLASVIPVRGFYRIRTTETDLSLLFVTLLAFARSGASDDRGGNMKTIMGTLKKLGQK